MKAHRFTFRILQMLDPLTFASQKTYSYGLIDMC